MTSDLLLNRPLLEAIAQLAKRKADATLTLTHGSLQRVLHISKGKLARADSNIETERFGKMVAQEKGLHAELIEAIAVRCQAQGKLLGDQLMAERLITPAELAAILERQGISRFERALVMPGTLTTGPKAQLLPILSRPLPALVVSLFRDRLPSSVIPPIAPGARFAQIPSDADLVELNLQPAELRVLRRLSTGESLQAILAGAAKPEAVHRLLAALVCLELLR